jgi:hypothetical protein
MATVLDHLHSEIVVGAEQIVQVTLGGNQSNVLLLDDDNYEKYRKGESYTYRAGGAFSVSPAVIRPPTPGRWHLVIDLGGAPGQVVASVCVRPA